MKHSFFYLFLQSLLLLTGSFSQGEGDETVIDPNPPTYNTYSCAELEQTCGLETDRYYELVAGYNKYWIEGFPSVEAAENKDFEDRSGAYWRIRSIIGGVGFDDTERNENITLGPTLRVKPGETIAILMRNEVPPVSQTNVWNVRYHSYLTSIMFCFHS
jgi:FtsP/CotA-like multicopper oxidase with cupredoxin domain